MSLEPKLISALQKLTQESFSVTDDTILDKLYFHIVNSPSFKEDMSTMLPQLCDWVDIIIEGWSNKELFYGVKIFLIRLIGNIGSDRVGFNMLQHNNVLTFLKNLASSTVVNSCFMVPLINTFEMFLEHEAGWKWTTETKIWRNVVNASHEEGNIYTKRAGIKFISQMLIKSTTCDTNVGKEIMGFVCEPLLSNHLLVLGSCTENTVNFFEHKTEPFCGSCSNILYKGTTIMACPEILSAAKYLCGILEIILKNDNGLPVKIYLVYRYNNGFNESVLAKDILHNCSSIQEQLTYASLLLMVEVSKALSQDSCGCITLWLDCYLKTVQFQILCIVKSLVKFGHWGAITNFFVSCLSWIVDIKKKKNHLKCDLCDSFQSNIVDCMLSFLCIYEAASQQYFNQCTKKCIVQSAQYIFKKDFEECFADISHEQKKMFQIMQFGVLALTRSYSLIEHHLSEMNIFNTIEATLSTLVIQFQEDEVLTKPVILQLLELISKIMHNKTLSYWEEYCHLRNGHKTITHSILSLLASKTNDIRVTVTCLQTLMKYLNLQSMTCLIQSSDSSRPDNNISCLHFFDKPIIAEKLKCESWEIRDTVIELLQTVIEVKEFVPWHFSKTFSPELLNVILEKATDDESAYVKASALRFFSIAVRCKLFTDVILPNTLLDLAMKTLLEDNMSVARKSACDLITALYISFVPAVLKDADKIFKTLFLASTKDLDWEVRKTTLKFWQCTINKLLLEEMVMLNNYIIPNQNTPKAKEEKVPKIIKVLDILGEIGCLKAIWLSLNDDCDLKVSQEAQCIVENLETLNEIWGFVNAILNSHEEVKEKNCTSSCRRLTPTEFFTYLRNENWRENISSRKQWIENTCDNLSSILDHILEDNQNGDWDHNAIDCY